MTEADEIASNYCSSELDGIIDIDSARRKARLIMSSDETEQVIDNVAEALLYRKRYFDRQNNRK